MNEGFGFEQYLPLVSTIATIAALLEMKDRLGEADVNSVSEDFRIAPASILICASMRHQSDRQRNAGTNALAI